MVACISLLPHDEVMRIRQENRRRFAVDHTVEIEQLITALNSNMMDIRREVVTTIIEPSFALHVILYGLDASYNMMYDVAQRQLTVEIAKNLPYLKLLEVGYGTNFCGNMKYGYCIATQDGVYEFHSREMFENSYPLSKFYSTQ